MKIYYAIRNATYSHWVWDSDEKQGFWMRSRDRVLDYSGLDLKDWDLDTPCPDPFKVADPDLEMDEGL